MLDVQIIDEASYKVGGQSFPIPSNGSIVNNGSLLLHRNSAAKIDAFMTLPFETAAEEIIPNAVSGYSVHLSNPQAAVLSLPSLCTGKHWQPVLTKMQELTGSPRGTRQWAPLELHKQVSSFAGQQDGKVYTFLKDLVARGWAREVSGQTWPKWYELTDVDMRIRLFPRPQKKAISKPIAKAQIPRGLGGPSTLLIAELLYKEDVTYMQAAKSTGLATCSVGRKLKQLVQARYAMPSTKGKYTLLPLGRRFVQNDLTKYQVDFPFADHEVVVLAKKIPLQPETSRTNTEETI